MIQVSAEATLPAPVQTAFESASDLEHAAWLPSVRSLHHVGGPASGVGSRFEVEVGIIGKHLRGVLVCTESVPFERITYEIEGGLELTTVVRFAPVSGGCTVAIVAEYSVRGAFGAAVERASAGPARREVARAVEQFASQFGRKDRRTASS